MTDKCRAEFEKWCFDKWPWLLPIERPGDTYLADDAQRAWEGWRAAWQAALNSRTTTPDPIFLCNDTPEVK